MSAIRWNYTYFYDKYNNDNLKNNGDRCFLVRFEKYNDHKKLNKPFEIIDFLHKGCNTFTKLNDLPIMTKYPTLFPMGLYCFIKQTAGNVPIKQIFFIYPSEQKCNSVNAMINKERSAIIANHFTFLIDTNISKLFEPKNLNKVELKELRNQNKPYVNCHMTTYNPKSDTILKGTTDRVYSYIPTEFNINDSGYEDANLFYDFMGIYQKVALDIIRKPFLLQAGGTKYQSLAQPKKRRGSSKKKSKTRKIKVPNALADQAYPEDKPEISAELQELLVSRCVADVTVIGLKLADRTTYSFTVFMTEEFEESESNSESISDSESDRASYEYINPLFSFVFESENPDYETIEKAIIKNLEGQHR